MICVGGRRMRGGGLRGGSVGRGIMGLWGGGDGVGVTGRG